MTRARLQALFREYRRRYFGGRLPRYQITMARRHINGPGHHGECLTASKRLFVNPGLADEQQRRVLLHEMCHIGCPSHGAKFTARLRRLAELGEGWAAEDAERCADWYLVNANRLLRQVVTDIALDQPEWSWIQARRALAGRMHFRPMVFERTYPWARPAWAKERSGARAFQQRYAQLKAKFARPAARSVGAPE